MKKRTLMTAAAVTAAGIATYFVGKKMTSRRSENLEPASTPGNQSIKSSAKARSISKSRPARPKPPQGHRS